jgi:Adenylate and Guanylate cyclase catalytic domain
VETVGDCYVAVTGLPDPRKDHAVAMARFARDCLFKTRSLTKRLEVTLGPDTGDLAMRMGMHSGPVTAGVSAFDALEDARNCAFLRIFAPNEANHTLFFFDQVLRGERSRFQLFGDVRMPESCNLIEPNESSLTKCLSSFLLENRP